MRVRRNGFTLIELGVLLAVLSLGVAYIAPDFVERARGELTVRAAKEMAMIVDASKWYYIHQGGDPADPTLMRWPGEAVGAVCIPAGPAQGALTGGAYLKAADFINPWGEAYDLTLVPGGAARGCRLSIATNVPSTVAGEMTTYMPMATCAGCPGAAAPVGFSRCCAKLVRPGEELMLQEWITPDALCDTIMGGAVVGEKCDIHEGLNICFYAAPSSSCGAGYVATGSHTTSCGKYCEVTQLRCCRAGS